MAAKDDLAKAEAALGKGVQSFTFENKKYSLTQLRNDLIPMLRKRAKQEADAAAAKAKTAAAEAKAAADRRDPKLAAEAVAQAQKRFDAALKRFTTKGTIAESEVRRLRLELEQAKEVLARLTPTPARQGTPAPTTTKPRDGSSEAAEAARLAGLAPKPGDGTGAKGAGATGAGAGTKKPDETKPDETKPGDTTGILDELAAQFPAYADWSVEQATAYFGADLIKVFNDVAAGVYGKGKDKSKEAITRAIEGTNYWRNTVAAIKNWDQVSKPDRDRRIEDQKRSLAQAFGELQLDDATLTDLATTIQRTGLDQLGAKQLVYGAAFTRPSTGTGPQSRQLALQSAAADQLRLTAKAYGFRPADLDAQIESVLSGGKYAPTGRVLTEEAFRQKAEQAARGAFPHLKDQFDSGLTLNDIFGNYREIASRVLELNPDQVDYMQDEKWFDAFGSQKDGLPSLSDWVTKLKTDSKYGWRFTNQANQQVSSVASTLERAFGLIK